MPNEQSDLDRVFHCLADPSRRAMVARLVDGPATVSELAEPLTMALPSVLQHLKVLEDSGLIRSEKAGRVRTCQLEPARLSEAEAWLMQQRALWEKRLDRLGAYLETLQAQEKKE
ncbi:MAG: metalloregulator ArsR/SmtB family transcription factor [Rhodovibrionaceae bacterium]